MILKTTKNTLLSLLNNALKIAPTQKQNGLGVFFSATPNGIFVDAYSETRFISQKLTQTPVETSETFTVDVKRLVEYVGSVTADEVSLEKSGDKLRVVSGKSRAMFPTTPSSQSRQIEKLEFGQKVVVDFGILKGALSNVLYATAPESTRPILTCVKLIPQTENNVVVVGTDGFRLSHVYTNIGTTLEDSIQIPSVFVRDAIALFDVAEKVSMITVKDGTGMMFEQGDLKVFTRLIPGDFPPYERVLVKSFEKSYVLDKRELSTAIKQMSVFARDNSNIILLKFTKGELTITPNKFSSEDNGVVVQASSKSDEDFSLAFNFKYVQDFLSSVDDQSITIRGNTSSSPVVFLPGEVADDVNIEFAYYQHVIMPVNTT